MDTIILLLPVEFSTIPSHKSVISNKLQIQLLLLLLLLLYCCTHAKLTHWPFGQYGHTTSKYFIIWYIYSLQSGLPYQLWHNTLLNCRVGYSQNNHEHQNTHNSVQ